MLVIPAIDLKDGQCVRLLQGREKDVTVYSKDPVATALRWQSSGARLIHIVDLDGAFTGEQKNFEAIKAIRNAVDLDIEVGGGIRDIERIKLLAGLGVNRVILGTVLAKNPELLNQASGLYPGRIIAGIDAKDGLVAVRGWTEVTAFPAVEFALKMESLGASAIIYTDISRDGMLSGPNIEATKRIADAVKIPVISSGGISTIGDIKKLIEARVIWGAITGKAIYSGSLDLKEAIKIAGGSQ